MRQSKTLPFLEAAMLQDTDDCIIWPFSVSSSGYGDFRADKSHWLAHRYICVCMLGEAPLGADAAHSCGVRLCVNKRHLRWATRKENHFDKRAHGRHLFGENVSGSILTSKQISDIRSSPASGASIARFYGVHRNTIYAVRKNRSWRHLL